ncbi:MAG: lipocalin [Methylococcaceae bacterium]|nr:lipocalin [Methylococcaceae bacterium]
MHTLLLLILMTGCTGIPQGLTAITGFDVQRYLGTWHEIARLDHRFERGLDSISATYSLREDGGINIVNQGYKSDSGEWTKAEGKAYFVEKPDVGRLKVSFFGPFFGGYNIIALDKKNYAYAMITGPDKDYLWILSRTPQLSKPTLQTLIGQAKAQGFATDKLIFVKQPT